MKKILYLRPSAGAVPLTRTFANLLEEYFPEYDVDVVDVFKLVASDRRVLAVNILHTIRLYWWEIIVGRKNARNCFRRTPYIFTQAKKRLRTLYERTDYEFSIQIQSLFDGSFESIPHYVYTDHTHLANLSYRGFSQQDLFHKSWIACEGQVYSHATKVLTWSSNISESIVSQYGIDPERVECVGCGTSSSIVTISDDAPRGAKNVLFVGMDWERKGGPALVEAFGHVVKRLPDARLMIVGCEPDIAPSENVEIVGKVGLEEVDQYFQDATVFCMPTRREPFGIVFVEAIAHSLPIIATKVGGLSDIVEEGESGYLVDVDDPVALADQLTSLLQDPDLCHRLGRRGRQIYDEKYSWTKIFARIREVVEEGGKMARVGFGD